MVAIERRKYLLGCYRLRIDENDGVLSDQVWRLGNFTANGNGTGEVKLMLDWGSLILLQKYDKP